MSIFKKITILFIISFSLMTVIGLWIDNINSKRIENLMKDKYIKVGNEILNNIDNKEVLFGITSKYNLNLYKIKKDEDYILLYKKKHTFGFISISKESLDNEYILEVQYLDEYIVLVTKEQENINDKLILNVLIFIDIIVLVLIFLYILKLLSPLKTIANKITDFSNGNLKSRIDIDSNDEIGILSNSFNKMASRLEKLIKTREELLRDIGHELRTPIAKGKFAIEKIDDFSQKELLRKIFLDLELLTNDLIELEKLNSNELDFTVFDIETLIVESLQRLHIEDESTIDIDIADNFKLNGDLHYLIIAVKNLIDNALKYTTRLPIKISTKNESIFISSSGEKLNKDLTYYLQPFTQELAQRDGFGLGLSIVNKIVTKHEFILSYAHKNQENIFIIDFKKR
ncbi:MAG: sensor histidine kinase [Arcobacter sp.]|nr:MAG: sensor histidine kinase [Arcobacter sp.]